MVFEIIVLALLVGKLRGGQIKKIENLYIKAWYILALSFSMEIMALFIVTKTNGVAAKFIELNFSHIHLFIYALLISVLLLNFHQPGIKTIILGATSNFLPLLFNNGKMPVWIGALENANLYNQLNLLSENSIMTHELMHENTSFKLLGDIIGIPKPYPFPKIISIGDILISVGIFILIYTYMTRNEKANKREIKIFKS